ncbi:MAG: hypothetical protein JWP52_4211, partial [Rhizobacter sp.]|nr:hypothetical protein [Rhizobacter sp.]
LEAFDRPSAYTIADVIAQSGFADPMAQRLIAWLWKFDLIEPLAS